MIASEHFIHEARAAVLTLAPLAYQFFSCSSGGKVWTCRLCDKSNMSKRHAFGAHFSSDRHQTKVRAVSASQKKLRDGLRETSEMYKKAESIVGKQLPCLYLPSWQMHVKSLLLDALLDKDGSKSAMGPVEKTLRRYELRERLALLELAVWKAGCKMNPPDAVKDALAHRYWWTEGWKASKQSMRSCPAIHVVVTNVLPFL
jgi:hypothetical protein